MKLLTVLSKMLKDKKEKVDIKQILGVFLLLIWIFLVFLNFYLKYKR